MGRLRAVRLRTRRGLCQSTAAVLMRVCGRFCDRRGSSGTESGLPKPWTFAAWSSTGKVAVPARSSWPAKRLVTCYQQRSRSEDKAVDLRSRGWDPDSPPHPKLVQLPCSTASEERGVCPRDTCGLSSQRSCGRFCADTRCADGVSRVQDT